MLRSTKYPALARTRLFSVKAVASPSCLVSRYTTIPTSLSKQRSFPKVPSGTATPTFSLSPRRLFATNPNSSSDIFSETTANPSKISESTLVDPLQIYDAKVASGELFKDEAQYRAAVELQKLSQRLVDYKPPTEFRQKIKELSKVLEEYELEQAQEAAKNPNLKQKAWYLPDDKSTELIKQLSDEDELLHSTFPQGLLLHGEVGCGKSMLMDLFADSVPQISKHRIHYNNFMLSLYAHIHQISEQRRNSVRAGSKLRLDNDFILLQLAERMIDRSTVLLLDEFMLPDIASAKIVQTLFTFYFKLGGVLVATSNRLPEELYSTDFRKSQFTKFFRVLQARCVSHDMRSENDWRSILSNPQKTKELLVNQRSETEAEAEEEAKAVTGTQKEFPNIQYYHKIPNTSDPQEFIQAKEEWDSAVQAICGDLSPPRPSHIVVYGHKVNIPWSKDGIAYFDFQDICGTYLAAADYISLVSRFNTFVIDNVPALKITQKNEARRFILLLDALYEAKCRLLIRAEVPPEDLFFADVRDQIDAMENETSIGDQVTYSAAYQDSSQPFRPNVSSYENNERGQEGSKEVLSEEEQIELEREKIRKEAEERFHAQLKAEAEMFKKHEELARKSLERFVKANPASKSPTAEQMQSKKVHNNNDESIFSSGSILQNDFSQQFFPSANASKPGFGPGGAPNFSKTSAFTGEDERFAYKRAVSRLREMTGSPRWVNSARWLPSDNESRPWEVFDETRPHSDGHFLGALGRTTEKVSGDSDK